MSNSNGSTNGRESCSGPERVAKSISQRVKNAFSALSRFSPRRRSRSIQAQAHSSSEDEPSASDLEVESYLSTGTGSSSTDASSDDDATSPDPTEPILLNHNSEEAIPTAQPPAAPATSPSHSQEAVLNYRVVHSTSTPISQPPPTSTPLPILDPTNPRSYGAFKKDRVPRLPDGYSGIISPLPSGFQRTTPSGLVRQYAYDDIEDCLQGHGLRREFAVHEDTHPGLRSPLQEEWWVYTDIRVERSDDGSGDSDSDGGSSSSGSRAPSDSSAPRSRRGRGAPSPPSGRPRQPPTPGPSSSGYSHTASDDDSQNPSAARSRRRYTPYPSRRPTSSYPSPSIYLRPNPSFMRSRVGRRRAQVSSPAGASDGDSDMEGSGDDSDANVGAQQVGQPSQNSQPSVSDGLLQATADRFLIISEVERPIFCEPPPIPVLDTVDDLDGTLAFPLFSAYSTPYYPPWSTTTAHPAPPGPHVVPWYPDIEHPDHSSMVLPPLESNKDLPFGDLTLPPIRTDASSQADPSQQLLPSLFFPEVPNLSEYHRLPRSVRNQIRPLPEPFISRAKEPAPPRFILDRIPPSNRTYPAPAIPLPSSYPAPPEFHNKTYRHFIQPGNALGLAPCEAVRHVEDDSDERPTKRQKVEHIPVEERDEGGLTFVVDAPFSTMASVFSVVGSPSGVSIASGPGSFTSVPSVAGPSRRAPTSHRASPYPVPSSSGSAPLRRSARISAAKAREKDAKGSDAGVEGKDSVPGRKGKGKRKSPSP